MKKYIFVLLCLLALPNMLSAQSDLRIRNHNLIFNAELNTGNVYSFAASSVVTGLMNYYLLKDDFFENSFVYSFYQTDIDGMKIRAKNPQGLAAYEVFNNLQGGIKIGYQTYRPEFFNFGVYASGHYKLEQFDVEENSLKSKHQIQRVLCGATALLSLGSMEQASRVIIEAGLRYSIGVKYESPWGNDKSMLNNGLVSHFAIKVASRGMMQNLGLFADIGHFDLFKNLGSNQKVRDYVIGFTWTITPQQADDRR